MGIRISKKMGFFLPAKDISSIFDEHKLNVFVDNETNISYADFRKQCLMYDDEYWVNVMHHNFNKENFDSCDYICPIYEWDNFVGYLFQPFFLKTLNRHSDTMDHYNHMNQYGKMTFVVNPIPDNPCCSGHPIYIYNYQGATDNTLLVPGQEFIDPSKALAMHPAYRSYERPIFEMIKNGLISIKNENEIWAMAELTDCLLPTTSQAEFNKIIKPSIVTSWS